jgi:predicted DNA-binding transcriptional regulator AlpA
MRKRLRFRDLEECGLVNNRVTLQNWIRDRGFPPGQMTGPNSRTWGEEEVEAWIDSRPTAPKPIPPLTPGKRRGRPSKANCADPEAVSG